MKKSSGKKKKMKLSLKIKRVFLLLFSIFVMGLSTGLFLLYGPYPYFRNNLVTTAMTTMSHQYLARMFYSEKYIQEILDSNYVTEPDGTTNPNLIKVPGIGSSSKYKNKYEKDIFEGVSKDTVYKKIKVKGTGYDGYIVAVYKPEKVKIAVSSKLGTEGETVKTMVNKNNALIGLNGGGFFDPTWQGNGAIPHGTVIKDGKIVYDYTDAQVGGGFIGFDQDNKLVLGRMTKEQAVARGLRDAMEFGPFLIVNGTPATFTGDAWGIAPRSAIAQRADGIVLLVAINGRNYKTGIVGINLRGLTELLVNYGAVNAANLDGGTSSVLIEKGELLNNPISSSGKQGVQRRIPVAWIVTK